MSGYDIKKIVDVGLSHFWNENYGQIYPTLDSLVRDGLATKAEDRGVGKRRRHLYSITQNGAEALQEWLGRPAVPPVVRNELQLKFFLSSKLPTRFTLGIVKEYRSQQVEMLRDYRESEAILRTAIENDQYPAEVKPLLDADDSSRSKRRRAKQCTVFLLTLRHGILVIEARINWCDEAISQLS
jgi:DNA-binding PadR family transcriptional regulator